MSPKYFDLTLDCGNCNRKISTKLCVFYFRTHASIGCKVCRNCYKMELPPRVGVHNIGMIKSRKLEISLIRTY